MDVKITMMVYLCTNFTVHFQTLKSFVWIQNADGSMQEVEGKVAMLCPTLCREMQSGFGYSRSNPISLPSRVRPSILRLVFLYCKFHDVPGFSYEVRYLYLGIFFFTLLADRVP